METEMSKQQELFANFDGHADASELDGMNPAGPRPEPAWLREDDAGCPLHDLDPGYDFDPMSNPGAIDGEYAGLVGMDLYY